MCASKPRFAARGTTKANAGHGQDYCPTHALGAVRAALLLPEFDPQRVDRILTLHPQRELPTLGVDNEDRKFLGDFGEFRKVVLVPQGL